MERLNKILFYLLLSFLIVFITVRAFTVAMTYDETGSFIYLIDSSIFNVFFGSGEWNSANNHVINTLCMQLGYRLFGPYEAALRWGSVVAGLIYFRYAYKLSVLWNGKYSWRFLFSFFILNSCVFLLEFFSLARGYSMVATATLASIYYINVWISNSDRKYFKYAIIALCIGLFGNLTVVLPFGAFFILSFLYFLKTHSKPLAGYLKLLLPSLPYLIVTAAMLAMPVYWLSTNGELEYGPDSIAATLFSLVKSYFVPFGFFFKMNHIYTTAIAIGISMIALYFITAANVLKGKKDYAFFNFSLFLIMVLLAVLQHWVMGSNYPENRTAIVFYIPVLAGLAASVNSFRDTRIRTAAFILVTGLLLTNFILLINFKSSREWWFDIHSRRMAYTLMEENNRQDSVLVQASWMPGFSPNFYLETQGYDNIRVEQYYYGDSDSLYVDPATTDYLLVLNYDFNRVKNKYKIVRKGKVVTLVSIVD